MPSKEQLRSRLLNKLSELFQLDQPDLDFGFYRIMHAKAREVREFIDNDLLKIVEEAFGDADEARKVELKARIDKEMEAAREYGVADPENSPKVQEARDAYNAAKDTAGAEAEVYDHLYRFFERYYEDGDFISRRYYTRETSGKAAPFAIPYNGEEIKLHWANADQYYIKTTEYFSNFTFDLRRAKEIRQAMGTLPLEENEAPLKIHFRVVEATEGEHGNVKAGDASKRFFIIHKDNPIEFNDSGELVCNFEYRPDPEKAGKEANWREKRNAEAVQTILEHLESQAASEEGKETLISNYLSLFRIPAPTEKDKKRPLLAKYVNQYTARNTMDYFIHKDLGGFLRRELDFYIKNEVMHLDDIENADAPTVENYLARIKVLRKIAHKLIDFLAQLENFQKKLWLKKKFVLETNYCLTLDRVPEELYPEVANNEAQCEEWIRLFAIDEMEAFARPLSVEFLKSNDKLVLDTCFFDEDFKARLLASMDNLDEQCDGLLINGDNFHGITLLGSRYRAGFQSIYIDPPYNTSGSEIAYKNEYRHSSWLSLLGSRLEISKTLMNYNSIICVAIDDAEAPYLIQLLAIYFGENNHLATVPIRSKPQGRAVPSGFSPNHEYAIFFGASSKSNVGRIPRDAKKLQRYQEHDAKGIFSWANFRGTGANSWRVNRPKLFYPIYVKRDNEIYIPQYDWNEEKGGWVTSENIDGLIEVLPLDENGVERVWTLGWERAKKEKNELLEARQVNGTWQIYRKYRPNQEGTLPGTWWDDPKYSASESGTKILKDLFPGLQEFSYPKSIYTVIDCLRASSLRDNMAVLDYFAGSGTTGHAVINLNREDGGNRKYILVEMGDYFETVLKPRIAKAIYSDSWKNGKPTARDTGISHCFKYIRLESYEDTLNNLRFEKNPRREQAVTSNPALKEDYMLRYMLDVETRGSRSLLNIDSFTDPSRYTLKVKKPGTDEYVTQRIDLIETFNYLIGLRVKHVAEAREFTAEFKHLPDPELPEDQRTKLAVDGRIRRDPDGPWRFSKVEGWVPKDPANPNNGQRENVLIVWRKLTGDIERDNLMLNEWFRENRANFGDCQIHTIYVNGSNNLANLKMEGEDWKVRLIEEEFMKRMWETKG